MGESKHLLFICLFCAVADRQGTDWMAVVWFTAEGTDTFTFATKLQKGVGAHNPIQGM